MSDDPGGFSEPPSASSPSSPGASELQLLPPLGR